MKTTRRPSESTVANQTAQAQTAPAMTAASFSALVEALARSIGIQATISIGPAEPASPKAVTPLRRSTAEMVTSGALTDMGKIDRALKLRTALSRGDTLYYSPVRTHTSGRNNRKSTAMRFYRVDGATHEVIEITAEIARIARYEVSQRGMALVSGTGTEATTLAHGRIVQSIWGLANIGDADPAEFLKFRKL